MAHPEPLLRGRAPASTAGARGPAAPAIRARAVLRRALPDAVHPPGGRARRLHRRGGPSALHGAGVPEALLESHRVHHRADRAHLSARASSRSDGRGLRDAGRLEPAGRRRGVGVARARAGRARRRGLGGRLVQLHQPAQPDADRLQQRPGQRLRDLDARPAARPHLSGRVPGRAAAATRIAVEGSTRPAWSPRWRPTTCCGGCTRSGCWSSAASSDVVPQLVALVRDRSVDAIGTNGAAMHALWTLHGLGALNETTTRAPVGRASGRAAAIRPAACARRQRWSCRATRRRPRPCSRPACAGSRSAHAPRGVPGAGRDAARRRRLAARCTRRAATPQLRRPLAGPALFIAAHRHRERFLTDIGPIRTRCRSRPCPSRCASETGCPTGASRRRQTSPPHWKDMEMPGSWESQGLPSLRRRRLVHAHDRPAVERRVRAQPDVRPGR